MLDDHGHDDLILVPCSMTEFNPTELPPSTGISGMKECVLLELCKIDMCKSICFSIPFPLFRFGMDKGRVSTRPTRIIDRQHQPLTTEQASLVGLIYQFINQFQSRVNLPKTFPPMRLYLVDVYSPAILSHHPHAKFLLIWMVTFHMNSGLGSQTFFHLRYGSGLAVSSLPPPPPPPPHHAAVHLPRGNSRQGTCEHLSSEIENPHCGYDRTRFATSKTLKSIQMRPVFLSLVCSFTLEFT